MTDTKTQVKMLTRVGFMARGFLYMVIAMLVITTGRAVDPAGALRFLGEEGGQLLLTLMAVGFVAYGLWRLSDAAFNIEQHSSDRSGVAARLGGLASGLIHLFLAWQAVKLLRGARTGSSTTPQDGAQSVLQLPVGDLLLIIGGIVLLGVGAYQLIKAAKASFLKHLEPRIASQPWAKWTGRLGYASRGATFLIAGAFLAQAGLEEQASEAGGMAEALSWLDNPWDVLVAAGLFAFGVFSIIEARYRVIHDISMHPR